MTARDLNTREWQRFRAHYIATAPPTCGVCSKHVNKTLPGNHIDGPTVDHIIPRSQGGAIMDPANCQLAHLHCNSSKQDTPPDPPHSRDW